MTLIENSSSTRVLSIDGAVNIRDFGGYLNADGRRVKTAMVYRSGEMSTLTKAGTAQISALGIRLIMDLRRPSECDAEPTSWHLGGDIEYWTAQSDILSGELAQLTDNVVATADEMHDAMVSLYRQLPTQHAGSYREMFRLLTDGSVPMVVNCAAGKDRTGVAAALVLEALGVPRETIAVDYLLTNQADLVRRVPPRSIYSRLSHAALDRLLAADMAYLDAMYAEIDHSYGGIDSYLNEKLGLTDLRRARLRELLLEPQ